MYTVQHYDGRDYGWRTRNHYRASLTLARVIAIAEYAGGDVRIVGKGGRVLWTRYPATMNPPRGY